MLKPLTQGKKTVYRFHSVLFLGLLFSPLTALHAAEIIASSSIQAVTVYPGSAKVTRLSKIELVPGDNDIVIKNLPSNLNESSLRVSGEGHGSISLGSVQLSKEFLSDVVQTKEKNLRDRIEEIQENKKVIEDSIARSESQLIYINQMVLGNNNAIDGKETKRSYYNLPLEQWQSAWQTLNDSTKMAQEEIREANKAIKENDNLLRKLNKELRQVATNQKQTRIAKLQVTSNAATTMNLQLTYQINGARWEPVYDADLNTESGDIELKTLAQISQRTGENWDNVDVTLSTLRPSAGTQLPELRPWVLSFAPKQNNRFDYNEKDMSILSLHNAEIALDESSSSRVQKSIPKPSLAAAPVPAMSQQQSRLISSDFSAEFIVPSSISLQSGSDKKRFALNTKAIKSTIKLASSPRLDPRVMLLATADYKDDTPLLSGSLSLYRNGNFVGNSYLSQKLSGEEIKLSFGEDDKVKINFLPDPDRKRNDGFFGNKKVVERHYKVSINSNHNKPLPITLSDVFPVASDENIKVKSLGEAPTHKDVDDQKGVISWDKTLTPNKPIEIQYGYSVSYPEDRDVNGL